jgi:uncharacterized membrane protein
VRARPRLLRIVRARPRLFSSFVLGLVVSLALMAWPSLRSVTRFLVGWDLGVGVYLALAAHMMTSSDIHRIRHRAREEDEGQAAILGLTVTSALVSMAAIFAHLGTGATGDGGKSMARLVFVAATILLSWAFIHTMFALHYAHEYYDLTPGGMVFPGDEREPDYWDFVYFSFVIGMTSQVSDVTITCKPIRRTVLAHGIVSFAFNAALLALTINLAASVI